MDKHGRSFRLRSALPAAAYVCSHGMMRGLSEDRFAPCVVTDRAMTVTILHRLCAGLLQMP